jgi:hypothetical protein
VLELVVSRAELRLGALQLGDVELDPLPVQGMAGLVGDQGGDVAEPERTSVARDQPILAGPGPAGLVVPVVCGEGRLAVVGMEQLHPDVRLIEPLLACVAEGALDVGADVEGAPVVVGRHHVDGGREVLDQARYSG